MQKEVFYYDHSFGRRVMVILEGLGFIISWNSIFLSILGVFLIVILIMSYASKKIKKENILEALREEYI